jgi:CRP-like cAMP-binding protein
VGVLCGRRNRHFADDLAAEAEEFQDYVIVHELLHLRYRDHGRQFKAMMTALVPNWLARDLIRRVAEDEERIMRLARDPVDVRLAWLLVYLARLGDTVEDDGSLGLPVNLSREDLALWIGAKRRSVGAALQDWRSRGVTASRHGNLVIRDLGFLITKADIPRDRRAAPQLTASAWRLVPARPQTDTGSP